MKKLFFIVFLFSLICATSIAQTDTIYTNTEKIACSVKEITPESVKYVYPGEEVLNSLYKNAIQKIVFKSGRVQTFAEATSYKTVKGALDFENVSLTSVQSEVNGLFKVGDVSSKAKGTTVFASMEKVKERAYKKLKIEAAMMGANVIYLTQNTTIGNQAGTQFQAGHPTETNLAGVAYSNKLPDYTEFSNLLGTKTRFQCVEIIKLSQQNADMSQSDVTKDVEIYKITNESGLTMVNAKIDGVDYLNFRVINFNADEFTLTIKDGERIYNYRIRN